MARWYTRAQQRRYREERKEQAARVAERLMGKKKKVDPGAEGFFSGRKMMTPIYYGGNMVTSQPRIGSILFGKEGV